MSGLKQCLAATEISVVLVLIEATGCYAPGVINSMPRFRFGVIIIARLGPVH